jgi:hypothetical protein
MSNKAGIESGGLGLWARATAKIYDTAFLTNYAVNRGGSICMGEHITMQVTSSLLYNNTATSGGALYAYGNAAATLHNVSMVGNKASNSGGGAYIWDNASLAVSDGQMLANHAADSGGFLAAGNRSKSRVVDTYFNTNTAKVLGGVFRGEIPPMLHSSVVDCMVGCSSRVFLAEHLKSMVMRTLYWTLATCPISQQTGVEVLVRLAAAISGSSTPFLRIAMQP